jgi:hypothetical protein
MWVDTAIRETRILSWVLLASFCSLYPCTVRMNP